MLLEKKRYRKVLPCLDTIAIKIFSWDLNKWDFFVTVFYQSWHTIWRPHRYIGVYAVGNYMFKVNIRNTKTGCKICSKLTIKVPCSSVSNVNFEQVNAGWVKPSGYTLYFLHIGFWQSRFVRKCCLFHRSTFNKQAVLLFFEKDFHFSEN